MSLKGIMEQVVFIDKIGGMDAFCQILHYLKPWELIALRSVCKEFNHIDCIRQHSVERHYDFFERYFQNIVRPSVIQLYCRPLIDETMTFFKYHTLIKICFGEMSQYPNLLQSLKYLLLFQKEFIASPQNNKEEKSAFAKNITQMEGLYVSNRKEAEPMDKFIKDVLTNYSANDNEHFKLLFFNHCNLGNVGLIKICKTILHSPQTFHLETCFLSNDVSLNDDAMDILFTCIELKLPQLQHLCIRHTGISDETCNIIHGFYEKYCSDLCFCMHTETTHHFHRYPIKLSNINITFNNNITSKGIQKLNELFYVNEEYPHKNECFFSSLAIATSVSFNSQNGFTLSSRFRILNQSETKLSTLTMAVAEQHRTLTRGYIRHELDYENASIPSAVFETLNKYSSRKHITLGLFGTFRSGKSTLGGRIYFHQFHSDGQNHSNSNKNANWSSYFDSDENEQIRKMTIHGNMHQIKTMSYQISLIDCPGNKRFIKNFLRYISQSDVVLLVFSATDLKAKYISSPKTEKYAFEGYFDLLTKLRICKLFEIKQMIVAVNKMDSFNFSKEKYTECKLQIQKLLTLVGYQKKKIAVIPISAMNGDNVLYKSSNPNLKWWIDGGGFEMEKIYFNKSKHGIKKKVIGYNKVYTLYDAIENIKFSEIRMYNEENIINIKPFKMSICNIYDETLNGSILSGRIENGKISIGTTIKCFPSGCCGQIKSIQMFHKECKLASFGDIIGISLDSFLLHPKRGDIVINEKNTKDYEITRFEAIVDVYPTMAGKMNKKYKKAMFDSRLRIYRNGFSPIVYTDNAIKQCQCQIVDIIWKLNKKSPATNGKTNEYQQKILSAQHLETGDTAKVLFQPSRQFAVGMSQKIVILEHKQMVMAGKVTKLHYADEIIEGI